MFDLPFQLPPNWEITTVGELVDRGIIEKPLDGNHGGTHPKSSDYVNAGIPFVMASDLDAGRVTFDTCKFISIERASSLRKGFSKKGDVLISHKATIGRTAIVQKNEFEFLMLTPQVTYCRVKDCNKLNNIYLKAYFDSSYFQAIINLWAGAGSTRAYLGITDQLKLPVILPTLEAQLYIANISLKFNEKIHLNTQTNQTLESIAQAIFKSWFVDFDPVKAKITALEAGGTQEVAELAAMTVISGKDEAQLAQLKLQDIDAYQQLAQTAALFPTSMQGSELGEIPEGWEVQSISDISKFPTGKVETLFLNISNYISAENMLENRAGITSAASLPSVLSVPSFYANQILVSNIRPYFKKIWLARFNGGRSNDVLAFEAKEKDCTEFLYNLIYQDEFFEFMMRTSKVAKMPRGDKSAISDWKLPCADQKLRSHYSTLTRPYYSHIETLNNGVTQLSKIRDALLPKLLSGEITIPETESSLTLTLTLTLSQRERVLERANE